MVNRSSGVGARGFGFPRLGEATKQAVAKARLIGHSGRSFFDPGTKPQLAANFLQKSFADAARKLGLDRSGSARLLGAISSGDVAEVSSLVAGGVDPSKPDIGGNQPVVSAASRGQLEMLKIFQAAGADFRVVDPVFRGTAMHAAAVLGDVPVLRFLAEEAKVDPDVQGPSNGYTALMDAIRFRRTDAAAYLRTISAPDVVDYRGRTAAVLQAEIDAESR